MYNDSFRIRYGIAPVAISENTEHYDTAPHIHGEIELLLVEAGRAEITVSDRSFKVTEGEMVIVNPMDVHSIRADRSLPYHQKCICFDTSLIADKSLAGELLSGDSIIAEYYSKGLAVTRKLKECFESLFLAVTKNSDSLLFESVAYVSLIFAALKDEGLIKRKTAKGKKAAFSRKVQEYLSLHYSEGITSEDAAREMFYTQSYFCRLFREHFGVSFLEYLSMYRISVSKAMMTGEDSITRIAEAVGFLDLSYFSKCFKRLVGVSPTEYRKSQKSRQ